MRVPFPPHVEFFERVIAQDKCATEWVSLSGLREIWIPVYLYTAMLPTSDGFLDGQATKWKSTFFKC